MKMQHNNATLSGHGPEIDLGAVLGLLAGLQSTGTFRAVLGSKVYAVRMAQGFAVKVLGDLAPMLAAPAGVSWTFRAGPVATTGARLSINGLLFEAARDVDHAARDLAAA